MNTKLFVKIFRILSYLEAISFLVLLGIAMPLKYLFDMPEYVRVVGMAHGVLFVLYVIGAYYLYEALNWSVPNMLHVPLIHDVDGSKLSKRRGAASIKEYQDMGYLSLALNNYLLHLGWSHKNDDIILR